MKKSTRWASRYHFAFPVALLSTILLHGSWAAAGQNAQQAAPVLKGGNVIKLAPLAWIHGQAPFTTETRVGYERRLSERTSLGISYSYLGTNYPFSFIGSAALSSAISAALTQAGHPAVVWTEAKIRAQGVRYQVQFRKYLSKRLAAPEGCYLSPHFSYSKVDYNVSLPDFDARIDIELTNRNYNLLFGYQRIIGRHFLVDLFTGLGYRDKRTDIVDETGKVLETLPHGTRLKVSTGFNVGWAF